MHRQVEKRYIHAAAASVILLHTEIFRGRDYSIRRI